MWLQTQQQTRMMLGARPLNRNTVAAAGSLALSSITSQVSACVRLSERRPTENHLSGSTVSLVGGGVFEVAKARA